MAIFKNKKQASQALAFLLIGLFFIGGLLALQSKKATLKIQSEKKSAGKKRKKPDKVIAANIPEGTEASITLNDFKRNSIKNDRLAWEIVGKQASLYNLQNLAIISDPQLTVIRPDKTEIKLSSFRAEVEFINDDIKTAALFQDVKFNTEQWDGFTEKAKYLRDTETISSESDVEIKTINNNVKGTGFEAQVKDKTFQLFDNVQSVITEKLPSPENKEKETERVTTITSVTASFDNQKRLFRYEENVKAANSDFTINSDKLSGNFSESQKIENLQALGHVRIERNTEKEKVIAEAEKADFDMSKEIIVLRGNPVIDKNGSKVAADIIYYYLKEDRSVAEGNVQALLPE